MAKIYLLCAPAFDSEWDDLIGYTEPFFASNDLNNVRNEAYRLVNEEIKNEIMYYANKQKVPVYAYTERIDDRQNRSFGHTSVLLKKEYFKHMYSILEIEVEDAPNV